jgi:BASS family bile acid:Na+ symporter
VKRFLDFIENNVSLILTLGVPLGLLLPYFSFLKNYITYFLMFVLFLTFLKMDIIEIAEHIKRPILIIYILIINLILFPALIYFVFKPFSLSYIYLSALVLFAAVPSGVASGAMTEIMKGKTPLTIAITIISHFVSAVTIPFVFFILFRKVIKVDYIGIMITMVKLIIIPLILAVLLKKFVQKRARVLIDKSRLFTIIPLLFISLIVMSVNYNYIIHNPVETIKYILISYPGYFIFMFGGYLSVFFLGFEERIAVMTAKTFTNISIGIVISMSFLDPKASLIITMAQIPWSTMILPAEYFVKIMRKNHSP